MNDRARDALAQAALNGTPQVRYVLSDGAGGRCAMGVLNEAATGAPWWPLNRWDFLRDTYDIGPNDAEEIVTRNNIDGWDFLTISRKVGVKEEAL